MTAPITFVEKMRRIAPPVLNDPDDAGGALSGTLALSADCIALGLRSAFRAPMVAQTDGDGPAYDALTPLGNEAVLPQYPGESWSNYRERLDGLWTDAPRWGADMVSQFEAAGFAGVEVKTSRDWPDMGAADYYSQFWIWFPLGTHSVVSRETQTVNTETGQLVEYDAEGLTLSQYRTINSVIARFKPGHYVCRKVLFEWSPTLIPSTVEAGDVELDGSEVEAIGTFAQPTSSLRPAWVADTAVADGIDDLLFSTDATVLAALNTAQATIAVQGQRSGAGAAQTLVGFRDAGGSVITVGFDSSNRFAVTRDGATVTASGADDGAEHVWIATFDGGLCSVWQDGAVLASGSVGASTLTLTRGELFANGASANLLDGSVRNVAIFASVLSPTHRDQIADLWTDPEDYDANPGWEITPIV